MAKQQINRKETKVATQEGVGQQYEQVVTVDDNLLHIRVKDQAGETWYENTYRR